MGESRIMFKVGDLVRISPEWLRECEDKIPMGVITRTYPETPTAHGGHSVDVYWLDEGKVYDGEDTRALMLLNES
jgi:hypothetical protein